MHIKDLRCCLLMCFGLIVLTGCAGLPVEEEILSTEVLPEPDRIGIYHKVNEGETLWRIAKTYGVAVSDIVRSNYIPDVAQVEKNQLIFIPGAHSLREVIVEVEGRGDDFIWPVKGEVAGYFKERRGKHINKGIDIKVPPGTSVRAARSGHVVFADVLTGYGKTVILSHNDGFHTVYAHNGEILVDLGDYVPKNTPLARVGHRNRRAYAQFQIRKNAIESNPLHYLP